MATRVTGFIVITIVAVTLVAGLIVGAQRDDNGPVDLIVFNGRVYTGESDAFAEAIAIRGNEIVRVGSNREIKRLRRIQTTIVDAHGAAVLPGFNDARTHFAAGALLASHADLTRAQSLTDLLDAIRSHAAEHPEEEWTEGFGWNPLVLNGRLPTRAHLDAVVPDRPARMVSASGDLTWVNSKALELARITRRTRSPSGGAIVKDPHTGEPTGVLKGRAAALLDPVLPDVSAEERVEAMEEAIDRAHRLGITSVQDTGVDQDALEAYEALRRAGDLRLRVYAVLEGDVGLTEADALALEALRELHPDDALLKTGGVEFVTDEAMARDRSPAAADALEKAVRLMDRLGWQVLIQAGSDSAVQLAIDVLERITAENPDRERRHRLELPGGLEPGDAQRLARLGVIASLNRWPADALPRTAEPGVSEADADARPAPSTTPGVVRFVFGSNWPAAPLGPQVALAPALEPPATPSSESDPDENEALRDAIDAYTSEAAHATFDERRKGTLAPGMLADVVILRTDIFKREPASAPVIEVEATIFDGKVVYSREDEGTE
jgi:predicted amidohydrolase YtcJ